MTCRTRSIGQQYTATPRSTQSIQNQFKINTQSHIHQYRINTRSHNQYPVLHQINTHDPYPHTHTLNEINKTMKTQSQTISDDINQHKDSINSKSEAIVCVCVYMYMSVCVCTTLGLTLASESRFAGSAGMVSSTDLVSTATTPVGIPPNLYLKRHTLQTYV